MNPSSESLQSYYAIAKQELEEFRNRFFSGAEGLALPANIKARFNRILDGVLDDVLALEDEPVIPLESVVEEFPKPKSNICAKITPKGTFHIAVNGWFHRFNGDKESRPVEDYDMMVWGAEQLDGLGA